MSAQGKGRWFTLFLCVVVAAFAFMTTDLNRLARMVPFWVLAVTLPLLGLQVLLDWRPGLAARLRFNEPRDLFHTDEIRRRTPSQLVADAPPRGAAGLPVIIWIISFPLLVALCGMVVAVPLHAVLYLVIRSRETLLTAFLVAAALCGLTVGALRIMGG